MVEVSPEVTISRHLAILDPGTRVPELDCFNRMSLRAPLPLTYHLPAMQGLDSLRRVEIDLAGVVILGSGASVHDDLGWQRALLAWLTPRLKAGLPMLGLCYGHQLLAHACGGDVDFLYADQTKLRGVREVPLQPNRLWGEACRGPLIISHREVVSSCPDGFEIVGSTPEVPIEAIAHRSLPQWGIQAHPEATLAFVANNSITYEGTAEDLAFGHGLVDAFVDRIGKF